MLNWSFGFLKTLVPVVDELSFLKVVGNFSIDPAMSWSGSLCLAIMVFPLFHTLSPHSLLLPHPFFILYPFPLPVHFSLSPLFSFILSLFFLTSLLSLVSRLSPSVCFAAWLVCLSVCLSLCVRPSVRHTLFTLFFSLCHHEVSRSNYHWQKWCLSKRSWSEVKIQGHKGTKMGIYRP